MTISGADIVHAQLGALPATDLRLNIKAVYTDSEATTVLVRWHGQERGIPVSLESAVAIISQAKRDGNIEGSEGYDDDPSATIFWLRMPNEYARHLTRSERAAVARFQEEAAPQPRQRPQQRRHFLTGHYRSRR